MEPELEPKLNNFGSIMYGRKLVSDPFNFADSKPDKDVKKLKNKSMIKAYPPHKAI